MIAPSASASHRKAVLKMILLGETGVGKTTLINKFGCRHSTEEAKATISTKDLSIDGANVELQIWDTADQGGLQSLDSDFYRGADCCALVFDVTNSTSFRWLGSWRDEFLVLAKPPDRFPFIVIGNKLDQEEDRKVSAENAQNWCAKRNITHYFEVSAVTGMNVEKAFMASVHFALTRDARKEGQIEFANKFSTPLDSYVRVFCRIKLDFGIKPDEAAIQTSINNRKAVFFEGHDFEFDGVFDSNKSQADVFDAVADDIVNEWWKSGGRKNGTIVVCGLNDSGKEDTIVGQAENRKRWGLLPRTLEKLCENIAAAGQQEQLEDECTEKQQRTGVKFGHFAFDGQRVLDLFNNLSPLSLVNVDGDSSKCAVTVTGLTEHTIDSAEEALKMVQEAAENVRNTLGDAAVAKLSMCFQIRRAGTVGTAGTSSSTSPPAVGGGGRLLLVDLTQPFDDLVKLVNELAAETTTAGDAMQILSKPEHCGNMVNRILAAPLSIDADQTAFIVCCSNGWSYKDEKQTSLEFGLSARMVRRRGERTLAASITETEMPRVESAEPVAKKANLELQSPISGCSGIAAIRSRRPPKQLTVAGQRDADGRTTVESMPLGQRSFHIANSAWDCVPSQRRFHIADSAWDCVRPINSNTDFPHTKYVFFRNRNTGSVEFDKVPDELQHRADVRKLMQDSTLMNYRNPLLQTVLTLACQPSVAALKSMLNDPKATGAAEEAALLDFFRRVQPEHTLIGNAPWKRSKCSYLLLDSRFMTDQWHPARTSFAEFVASIFYIGKGKEERPFEHFRKAIKLSEAKALGKSENSCTKAEKATIFGSSLKKKERILEIWAEGHGVHLLCAAQPVSDPEAIIREASIIRARRIGGWNDENPHRICKVLDTVKTFVSMDRELGCSILRNKIEESWRCSALTSHWRPEQAEALGVRLLLRAYNMFTQMSSCPIFKGDIDVKRRQCTPLRGDNSSRSRGGSCPRSRGGSSPRSRGGSCPRSRGGSESRLSSITSTSAYSRNSSNSSSNAGQLTLMNCWKR